MNSDRIKELAEAVKRLARGCFRVQHAALVNWDTLHATVDTLRDAALASAAVPVDGRLTVAAIAMATGSKMKPLMQAIEQACEGSVTANQKLTMDQALQAIAAAAAQAAQESAQPVATVQRGGSDVFGRATVLVRWEGKDCRLHSPEERERVWNDWIAKKVAAMRAAIAASGAAPGKGETT